MRILPDSHALLWWASDSERLSKRARALLNDDDNQMLFSAVATWEIYVKHAMGKLQHLGDFDLIEETSPTLLPITHAHAQAAAALPYHHRDPFDRMLIAQAQIEDAVIVTADRAFAAYDVRTVW
jgi:PIN domain nuclease of toxin-antitoxin system